MKFIGKLTLTVEDKTAVLYMKEEGHGAMRRFKDVDKRDATLYETPAAVEAAYAEYAERWVNPPTLTVEELIRPE